MARICPLFSGSTGNSTYLGYKDTGILIDVGMSCKSVVTALQNIDCAAEEIKAIAITHEHTDHIKGLKTFLKKSGAMLLASGETLDTLADIDMIPSGIKTVAIEEKCFIGDIEISRFNTSHDCKGSSGYTFLLPDSKKVSVCTDLGVVTDEVRAAITGSNVILLESNHDVEMLKRGPYPPQTKLRIMSDVGHISNNTCATEVKRLFENGTERFILGHLSLNNNTPLLAQSVSESVLMDLGAKNGKDYLLKIARPKENGVTVF